MLFSYKNIVVWLLYVLPHFGYNMLFSLSYIIVLFVHLAFTVSVFTQIV